MKYDVIIIGTGQAGLSTAISLRKRKFNGSILLIGDEEFLPYQRPPLSKEFLLNDLPQERLLLRTRGYFHKARLEILSGLHVVDIDKNNKSVLLDNDKSLNYGKLVLCTGSKARKLEIKSNLNNVFYLRTINDAVNIKNSLRSSKEIVILGGGYIGLEIAAVAVQRNIKVTIIESEKRLMKRSLSSEMSLFLLEKHKSKSVNFLLQTSIKKIIDVDSKKKIICSNGNTLVSDALIIGIGIEPNIDLASSSGIKCVNGIEVNENGKTSVQNIFAAGDCTYHPNPIYRKKIRLESVQNATDQAKSVAASILGQEEPYIQTPWFWSEQYNLKIKVAGLIDNYDYHFLDGDAKNERFAMFFIKNKKIIWVETINFQKAFIKGKKLIKNKLSVPKNTDDFREFIYGD